MAKSKSRKSAQKIPVLPRELRDGFFGADTSKWKFAKENGLTKEELEALAPVFEQIQPKTLWAIPEVNFPFGVKTPEVWADGVRIEVKTVTDAKKIDRQVRNSKHQINGGIVVVVDKTGEIPSNEIKTAIKNTSDRRGVDSVFVQNGQIKFVTETTRKEARELPTNGRAIIASYNSIIAQDVKKVKELFDKKKAEGGVNSRGMIAGTNRGKMPHSHYWEARAAARFEAQEQRTESYVRRIRGVYSGAERKTINEIKKLYKTYYRNDNTFDKEALRGIEPAGNVVRLKEEMVRLGLNQYLPDNYAFRMSRLEAINHQIWAELKNVGIQQNALTAGAATETINSSYNRAIFDAEKQFGSLMTFSKLDEKTVNEILNYKIEGQHFSNRIWRNTDILAEQINSKLATAISVGQSPEKTIREIRERFNVGRFYAERLVRTESAFYHNSAELRAYSELGIGKYRIVATLDGRTSEICQHKDRKIYKISEARQGENFPPFHPMCRTTTAAYFGEEFEPETRIARDPKTGKNVEVPNMSYPEWARMSGISKVVPRTFPKIKPVQDFEVKSPRETATETSKTGSKPQYKQNHTKIQQFVSELGQINNKTAQRLYNMISGKTRTAVISSLTPKQQEIYGLRERSSLIMTKHDFRHLINSGHITGEKKDGGKDSNPLTAQDLANIYKVFRNPDVIEKSNREGKTRFKIERTIAKQHRLILEVERERNRMRVVTFFNTGK